MMVQLCVASEQPQSGGPKLTHAQCEHDVHKHTSGAVTPPPSPGAGRLSKQWPPPAALVYFRSAAIAIYLSGRAGSRRAAAISLRGWLPMGAFLKLPLFRLRKNFKLMNTIIFVLFDKYCPIVDQPGSKDSSRDLQLNYVISYFFYLHLILHVSG
jgi:hypothetical protein